MNAGKTKFMSYNHIKIVSLSTRYGTKLEEVEDFRYLGALMSSTGKDVKQLWKTAAWRACNKLNKIWKSSLSRKFKLRLFSATIDDLHISHNASGMGANIRVLLIRNSSSHSSLDVNGLELPCLAATLCFTRLRNHR